MSMKIEIELQESFMRIWFNDGKKVHIIEKKHNTVGRFEDCTVVHGFNACTKQYGLISFPRKGHTYDCSKAAARKMWISLVDSGFEEITYLHI